LGTKIEVISQANALAIDVKQDPYDTCRRRVRDQDYQEEELETKTIKKSGE